LIVGMGVNGTSRIEVWDWDTSTVSLSLLGTIPDAFTGSSNNAPVNVAVLDENGDGIVDTILAVQGPIGTTGEIHLFEITGTSPFQYVPASPLTGFNGPWFIATGKAVAPTPPTQPEPIVPPEINVWTNPASPYDVNDSGNVTPLDALETINYINQNPGVTALPAEQFAPPRFFDTNVDGLITASDVLLLVNVLSMPPASSGEGESSEAASGLAAMFSPLATALDRETTAPAAAILDDGQDQALGAVDAALVPGVEWFLPRVELASPRVSPAVQTPLDAADRFDLEAILDDIAAEITALGT
jgi:hypothetical protein